MNLPSLNALAQLLAGQLGNCLAGGMAILLCAGLFSYLLREGSPEGRFAVWFTGLIAISGMPLVAWAWSGEGTRDLAAPNGGAAITLPHAWGLYLGMAWAMITVVALGRIAVGIWQVGMLRRRSTPVDPGTLTPEVQKILGQFQATRAVRVLLSEQIESPTAIGLLSPAIIIPRWLMEDLSGVELEQIVLHELAHLRRWDDWSNLLQKIVQALFFFHPAVWWMERQVSLEREMACDEAVLAQTRDPRAYAQCLVRLAEKRFFRRSVMLAQAAVSRVGQTTRRVARILNGGRSRNAGARRVIAPVFVATLAGCVVLFARAPQLIGFASERSAPVAVAASGVDRRVNLLEPKAAAVPAAALRAEVVAAHCKHIETLRKDPAAVIATKFGNNGTRPRAVMVKDSVSSEVVVVFVESRWIGADAEPMWQIQMWRITMLRMTNPASAVTPQKVI